MTGQDRGPHRDCLLLGTALALEVVGFYFTKPPSLEPDPEARVLRRHRAKSRAVNDLRRANLEKKEVIAEWLRQIRAAKV